jgi:hypothetical protein
VLKQTATAAREGTRKRGRTCKRWRDKVENKYSGNKQQAGNGQRQLGIGKDSVKSQGLQQIVLPEEEEEEDNFNMNATYFIFSYLLI